MHQHLSFSRQISWGITLFVKLGRFKKTLSSDYEKNAFSCSDPARLGSTMVGQEKRREGAARQQHLL